MVRELRAFQPLDGDAAALVAAFSSDPRAWLPTARRRPEGGWRMTVHGASWSREVHAMIGQAWTVTRTTWRSLSWEPVNVSGDAAMLDRMLPPLDGELGIHVDESGRATLVLDARYLPPGGLLGAAADAVALHRLARRTGRRLLQDIGTGLQAAATAAGIPPSGPDSDVGAPAHARTTPVD